MIGTSKASRNTTEGEISSPTVATKAPIPKLPTTRDTQGQISCGIRSLMQGYLLI
jgi:hypothetical protein